MYRRGSFSEVSATAEEVEKAATDAAHMESSLQAAVRCIDAFDVQITGTRRATCAGFLMRSSFAFFT